MINSFMPELQINNSIEVSDCDIRDMDSFYWEYGTYEIQVWTVYRSYKRISRIESVGIGKPFYRYLVQLRRSAWENWPIRIGYGEAPSLETGYDYALLDIENDLDQPRTF